MPRWPVPRSQQGSKVEFIPKDDAKRLQMHCRLVYGGDWRAFAGDLEGLLKRRIQGRRLTRIKHDLMLVQKIVLEAGAA